MPRNAALAHRAIRGPQKFISEGPYVRDPTHHLGRRFPCFYCPRVLGSESGRASHIRLSEGCRQADVRRNELSHTGRDSRLTTALKRVRFQLPYPETSSERQTEPEPTRNTPHQPPSGQPAEDIPSRDVLLARRGDTCGLEFDSRRLVFVERFPDPRAGAPINDEIAQIPDLEQCMIRAGNLGNPDYFDTAELLMTTGLTNIGRDIHLKSRLYQGFVPWLNNKQLMADIDRLPHGPLWDVSDIQLNEIGQHVRRKHDSYLFKRSVVETFRDLMANPEFDGYIRGKWWWDMQERMPDKYATLVPLLVSFDRSELSVMSGGQTVYPVYLTLANIDKSVRRRLSSRATALLAYLPVDKFANVTNNKERSRLKRQLVHRALEEVFAELRVASEEGVVVICPDGRYRRTYPIVAGIMLDYEEQAQMAGIMKDRCAKCLKTDEGDGKLGPPRTNSETLHALRSWLEGEGRGLADTLELRDRPVWPWWANLPHLDFAASLMPDLLHQLHQGMTRHLLKWSAAAAGEERVDRGFMLMPRAEGMRHFRQGVSRLKQWTGRESKEAAKQLLPVIVCLDGQHWDKTFVRLACALLDFTYRAQASRMTEDDVVWLEKTVEDIHKYKSVLVQMGVFQNDSRFDLIIKLHMLSHFGPDTRAMGTPDGFSTETPEHSHIESKRAWRASNKVRPAPQMIKFLQRYEALQIQRARVNAYLGSVAGGGGSRRRSHVVFDEDPFYPVQEVAGSGEPGAHSVGIDSSVTTDVERENDDEESDEEEGEDEEQTHYPAHMQTAADVRRHVVYPNPTLSIALKPTCGRVRGIDIIANHGATDLVSALHTFLNEHGSRKLPTNFLPTAYHEYPLWHRLYLRHDALPFDPEWPRRDVVRSRPASGDQESSFDVALALEHRERPGLHRYRAVRVRAIFALPRGFEELYPHPLVYVELFTPFSHAISPYHAMHSLSQLRRLGKRCTAVLPALDLAAACHLAPDLTRLDIDLSSFPDMLDTSLYFWLNHYYNRFFYFLVNHWRTIGQP
ncbi:hypothetical protein RhiLY_02213 [Ceratobasidium sp. AG-Ba]|nr:hypothetical protein RhiLY_02213 [Ceratobasidium sp. AG-Ba]